MPNRSDKEWAEFWLSWSGWHKSAPSRAIQKEARRELIAGFRAFILSEHAQDYTTSYTGSRVL
jgi:hypothetical protein